MMSKIAVAISVVGVACAIFGLTRSSNLARAPLELSADVFAPIPLKDIPPECQQAADLGALMRQGINQNMSKLSYQLFHSAGDAEKRSERLVRAANALRGCMERASAFSVHDPEEQVRFRYHLVMSKQNLNALQTAAAEHDEGALHHWFGHLKQDCVTCHSSCRNQFPANNDPEM